MPALPTVLHCFDFCGTLVGCRHSFFDFIDWLQRPAGDVRTIRRHLEALFDDDARPRLEKHLRILTLRGLSEAEFRRSSETFAEAYLVPRAHANTLAHLRAAIDDPQARVIVASGTFRSLIEDFLSTLGLGVDAVLANRLEVVDGHLTGRLAGHDCIETRKFIAIKNWLRDHPVDLARSTFYTDHVIDVAPMSCFGRRYVVKTADAVDDWSQLLGCDYIWESSHADRPARR